ncbi:MAG: hypothetical protein JWO31_1795 [Phycisphaerales bacterium]|nr:hypothetical protein [Phycisphaerales bacterium]
MPVIENRVSIARQPPRSATRITLAWTSDDAGNATVATADDVIGVLTRVAFAPGAGGTQPTAAYDVTLTDTAGVDVLNGKGADLSNTVPSHVHAAVPLPDGTTYGPCDVYGRLTIKVSGAGPGKTGVCVLNVVSRS